MRSPSPTMVLAVLLALAGCTEQRVPTAPEASQDVVAQPQLATLASGTAGYIVFAGGKTLPANLDAKVRAAGGVITGRADAIGVAFVSSGDPDFAHALKGVQVVPDALVEAQPTTHAAFTDAIPAGAGDDEPLFPLQWGMRAIHAPEAWDDGSFGEGVVVAVLDEGFDLSHPDLEYAPGEVSFACWQAPQGLPGPVVLSGPPYCEDVEYGTGFDFGPGAYGPMGDVFSHATHVSGIISALDNGIGVIGVAPKAHVLPVKVLSEYLGVGYTSWILQGILYAADAGVDVINMSLSGTVDLTSVPPGLRDDVMRDLIGVYRRAVNYAYQKGVTVVVAAGNQRNADDNRDKDGDGHRWIIPAEFENAITVSATGPYGIYDDPGADVDRPASYSYIGKSLVDFAAPGGDFVYPGPNWFYDMVLSTGAQNSWYWSAGTSMAAPHVAGVAALIIAEHGGAMRPAQVEAEMRHRADDLGKPGRDDFYGLGRISTGH